MARIRSLKPEFWHDRKLARSCSRDARMLYMGLWNHADEHSRCNGDVAVIKGGIFPYDDVNIAACLDELIAGRWVLPYSFDGDPYLFLPKLDIHQRLDTDKVASKFPPPPDDIEDMPNMQVVDFPDRSGKNPDASGKSAASLCSSLSSSYVAGSGVEKSARTPDPVQTIVAAYVEGAKDSGLPPPDRSLCARVGKQAKAMLATNDPEALARAAHSMGGSGWHDLAVEIQRSAANGRGQPNKATQRTQQGLAVFHNLQAERLRQQGEIA